MYGNHNSRPDLPAWTPELQDIAALDRLAATMAPPSALRTYAAARRADRYGPRDDAWHRLIQTVRGLGGSPPAEVSGPDRRGRGRW